MSSRFLPVELEGVIWFDIMSEMIGPKPIIHKHLLKLKLAFVYMFQWWLTLLHNMELYIRIRAWRSFVCFLLPVQLGHDEVQVQMGTETRYNCSSVYWLAKHDA